MEFIRYHCPGDVWVSKPTWANHLKIVEKAGLKVFEYPYWNAATKGLDFDGLKNCWNGLKPGTIVLIHVCAHNPTGVDPTPEQWKEMA